MHIPGLMRFVMQGFMRLGFSTLENIEAYIVTFITAEGSVL